MRIKEWLRYENRKDSPWFYLPIIFLGVVIALCLIMAIVALYIKILIPNYGWYNLLIIPALFVIYFGIRYWVWAKENPRPNIREHL